jgi:hypothetical protein
MVAGTVNKLEDLRDALRNASPTGVVAIARKLRMLRGHGDLFKTGDRHSIQSVQARDIPPSAHDLSAGSAT